MSATLGNMAPISEALERATQRAGCAGQQPNPPRAPRLRVPRDTPGDDDRRTRRGRQGAGLRRQLHPARLRPARPEPDQSEALHEGREEGDLRRRRGLPLRHRLWQAGTAVPELRDRHSPRRAAAEVPAAGREARPARAAQGHCRHGHSGRRRQRADPHRALQPAQQVRRPGRGDPQGPGLPADRRAGRPQGIRRAGLGSCARRRSTRSTTGAAGRKPRPRLAAGTAGSSESDRRRAGSYPGTNPRSAA